MKSKTFRNFAVRKVAFGHSNVKENVDQKGRNDCQIVTLFSSPILTRKALRLETLEARHGVANKSR